MINKGTIDYSGIFFLLVTSLLYVGIINPSYPLDEESFPAWSSHRGYVGIENFQHDCFSGSVAYSIPLEVAPGTNDVQPDLVLRYFSDSGNSIVGCGWSIDLGMITRSVRIKRPDFNDNDIFILQLGDTVSELVNIGTGQFRTKIEAYLRITKTGNTWLIEDRDGMEYEFNYNVGDLNYYLSKITDTHGNAIEISYFSNDNAGYIDEITYTKGSGLSKFRTIKFYYEDRNDNYPDNSTGKTVKYTKRLDYLDINVEGKLYKRYNFNYIYGKSSGKSLLSEVIEVSKEGVSLKLGQFNYINNTIDFTPAKVLVNPPALKLSDHGLRIGDVNGDNYLDLLKISSKKIEVCLGNGSGWAAVKTYNYDFINDDFASTNQRNIQLGDVNGDGLDDIIKSSGKVTGAHANYYMLYNNGDGWNSPVIIENTKKWDLKYSLCYSVVYLVYVNNDKYIDVVTTWNDPVNILKTDIYVCFGNGKGWDDPQLVLNDLPYYFRLTTHTVGGGMPLTLYTCAARLADINGDGLADFICSKCRIESGEFQFYYMLSNGSSWDGEIREFPASEIFNLAWSSTKVFDINRDGFPDIISGRLYNGDLRYRYHLGNGKSFSEEFRLNNPPPWTSIDKNVLFVDCDNDGIVDCLNVNENKFVSCKLDSPHDELLKEVVSRYGGKITYIYKNPSEAGGSIFPFSLPVLASVIYEQGVIAAPTETTSYSYTGGLYDNKNKLFRGFAHVTTTDPLGNVSHIYFHQDDSKLGRTEKEENAIKKVYYTYKEDSSAPYFTPVTQADEYADSKCERIVYDYDDYGNIKQTTYYGDKDNSGDERSVFTDYALNTSSWLLNLPSRERVFSGISASGSPLRETLYLYDNNSSYTDTPTKGDLTKVKQYLNTKNGYTQTASVYDSYGNEIEKTDANGNKTAIQYDGTYHSFPVSVTNAKGHIEIMEYYSPSESGGLFGQLKGKTDSNGSKISFQYDGFGRKTKVIGPYDTGSSYGSESYEYGINGPGSNYILTRTTEENGTGRHFVKISILDGFQRVIQSAQESENENQYSYVTTVYNKRGEAEKISLPYFKDGGLRTSYLACDGSEKWTANIYDAIGRITKITKPDSTTISNAYEGWITTVTDENNHQRVLEKDAFDRLVKVTEKNKGESYITNYSYDAVDNLIKIVDNNGNNTVFTYDTLSRRTALSDPDLGSWSYVYDDAGNLIQQTDADNNIISFTYDALNRLTTKRYEGAVPVDIVYAYDEFFSANSLGRHTSMRDLSGSTQWYYDKEGRVTKELKAIDGNNYPVERSYDAMGRVKSITYPNDKTVNFTYNNAGRLETVDGYCSDSEYNASGQVTAMNFNNSLRANFTYYPDNLRLKQIYTPSLQNLNYEYDSAGNIKKITDSIRSAVKNYDYDDLDRLLSGDSNSYEYNSIGNLVRKNGSAFGYNSPHPHAVTSNGQNAYSYDNAGNMVSGAGRTITYDSENRPIKITKDNITTYFTYDGDGNRVKKVVEEGLTKLTTLYIDDLYEVEFSD